MVLLIITLMQIYCQIHSVHHWKKFENWCCNIWQELQPRVCCQTFTIDDLISAGDEKNTSPNKKNLKNVGPIRDCEPPHAHSPGIATGTVHRCPRRRRRRRRRQRQRVTEGTDMAPWNGPNDHQQQRSLPTFTPPRKETCQSSALSTKLGTQIPTASNWIYLSKN